MLPRLRAGLALRAASTRATRATATAAAAGVGAAGALLLAHELLPSATVVSRGLRG